MSDENSKSNPEVIVDLVKRHFEPKVVTIEAGGVQGSVLILPNGTGLAAHPIKPFLDPFRERPERRMGTATLQDLASLIAHVNRFKDEDSAIFADRNMERPSITAVLDYHEACNTYDDTGGLVGEDHASAKPRFGQHRANYAFPLSDEWKAWIKAGTTMMDQQEFAEFLEDRIGDVMSPPDLVNAPLSADDETAVAKAKDLLSLLGGSFATPNRLMELSRGLAVHVGETVKQATNLSTGEAQVQYVSSHQDEQGQPLKVPNLFLVAIPVFRAGPLYQIAIRLRYRVRGASLVWSCQMYRPEKAFEDAFDEACETAQEKTGLPLFIGHPELPLVGQTVAGVSGSVGSCGSQTTGRD